jgi:hypothetical protein
MRIVVVVLLARTMSFLLTLISGLLGKVWRIDPAIAGPGKSLFRGEAAARSPALNGALATAGVIHARVGDRMILAIRDRDGKSDSGRQVGNDGKPHCEPAKKPTYQDLWHHGSTRQEDRSPIR